MMNYADLPLSRILEALSGLSFETLNDVEHLTFHAGVVLMRGKWQGELASDTLYLDTPKKELSTISYLSMNGVMLNAKSETPHDILDGRYPRLLNAISLDGIATVCRVNIDHCDANLLDTIEKRFNALLEQSTLDEKTTEIKRENTRARI